MAYEYISTQHVTGMHDDKLGEILIDEVVFRPTGTDLVTITSLVEHVAPGRISTKNAGAALPQDKLSRIARAAFRRELGVDVPEGYNFSFQVYVEGPSSSAQIEHVEIGGNGQSGSRLPPLLEAGQADTAGAPGTVFGIVTNDEQHITGGRIEIFVTYEQGKKVYDEANTAYRAKVMGKKDLDATAYVTCHDINQVLREYISSGHDVSIETVGNRIMRKGVNRGEYLYEGVDFGPETDRDLAAEPYIEIILDDGTVTVNGDDKDLSYTSLRSTLGTLGLQNKDIVMSD
jgi:hypothetical protein